MNYFGFWSSFYQLLDPDPDPGGKINADPSGSGYGSGSETLVYTVENDLFAYGTIRLFLLWCLQ
jgi:hypothetical protein